MLNVWKRLIFGTREEVHSEVAPEPTVEPAAEEVTVAGVGRFVIADHLIRHESLPILDWQAVASWVGSCESVELQGEARDACQRAWLLHLRDALGPGFRVVQSNVAVVLSSLEEGPAQAVLDYIRRTLGRIVGTLDGIAELREWERDILIIFENDEQYYRYVSYYYPEAGEFSISGGMFIDEGCAHFITVKDDLYRVERVLAHEMTHCCLSHLELPAWLNEGIAVNTEQLFFGHGGETYTPREMWLKHRRFWRPKVIQEFWSGKSFFRIGESNLLSYDLARIMVEQMAKDWESFKRFVLAAERKDAGAQAALEHIGIDLGEFACAVLAKRVSSQWAPHPENWPDEPERLPTSSHSGQTQRSSTETTESRLLGILSGTPSFV